MKDYHDLYLKYNVLLLQDVFQKNRNNSLKNYELCPRGHLKSTFIEEGRGRGHWKANKKEQGEERFLACITVCFFKNNAKIFK